MLEDFENKVDERLGGEGREDLVEGVEESVESGEELVVEGFAKP